MLMFPGRGRSQKVIIEAAHNRTDYVQGRMARFYAKKTNSLLGLEEPTYGHQAVGTGP